MNSWERSGLQNSNGKEGGERTWRITDDGVTISRGRGFSCCGDTHPVGFFRSADPTPCADQRLSSKNSQVHKSTHLLTFWFCFPSWLRGRSSCCALKLVLDLATVVPPNENRKAEDRWVVWKAFLEMIAEEVGDFAWQELYIWWLLLKMNTSCINKLSRKWASFSYSQNK